jgi:hypothetical protein
VKALATEFPQKESHYEREDEPEHSLNQPRMSILASNTGRYSDLQAAKESVSVLKAAAQTWEKEKQF